MFKAIQAVTYDKYVTISRQTDQMVILHFSNK